MLNLKRARAGLILLLLSASPLWAAPPDAPGTFDQILDRMAQREAQFLQNIRSYSPLFETYLQHMKPDPELGSVPGGDAYFLGRLDLKRGVRNVSFLRDTGWSQHVFGSLALGAMKLNPTGFAQPIILDDADFDRAHYDFILVRREFLGEVRCLVIDVTPKKGMGKGRFVGRIWVEDQDYNIVRFNGTYAPRPMFGYYFHFDSWRLQMGQGVWLPAYIYTEETDLPYNLPRRHLAFKAQSRLWGYDLQRSGRQDEFAQILVEPAPSVSDKSAAAQELAPVQAQRQWEHQAEDNVVERLERTGLVAPEGEVDKILATVVNNLLISNKLDVQPEVRCRVLLTAPLESFTIGHTIVLSRGLLDVLPDEATLASVLAHELGHILLGHRLNSRYAFSDRLLFADQETFRKLGLGHDTKEEEAADAKALDLLKNSPYKDQLASAGLFLRALEQHAPQLPNLIRAHLGNGLALGNRLRMSELIASAPALETKRVDQVAALPIGARIKVDPWSDRIEMSKAKAVPLLSPREKLMFEVTPFYPHLARQQAPKAATGDKVSAVKGEQ